jgi:uncharacterized membrane protein
LGQPFNDLPELPVDNDLEEAEAGDGAHLARDDATSAATANPAEDEITQIADSSAMQPGAEASTQSPKRSLDTKIATASASVPKRPCCVCTMKTGIMLLGEHSIAYINLPEYY